MHNTTIMIQNSANVNTISVLFSLYKVNNYFIAIAYFLTGKYEVLLPNPGLSLILQHYDIYRLSIKSGAILLKIVFF